MSGLTEKLQSFLQQAIDAKTAPGLVAEIFDSKDVLASAAAGVTSVGTGKPMTINTVGTLFSMSKSVTSICALVVAEKNNFDLDSHDELVKILPEFKAGSGKWVTKVTNGKDGAGKWQYKDATVGVTLRHLLSHTTGLAYEFTSEHSRDFCEPVGTAPSINSGLIAGADAPRAFEAGTAWLYRVSADWVSQYIERSTGKTLRQAHQEYIFTPLGIPPDTLDSFRGPKMNEDRAAVHIKVGEGAFIAPEPAIDTPQYEGVPPEGYAILGTASLHGRVSSFCIFLRAVLNRSPALLSEKFWDLATSDALAEMGISLPADPFIRSYIDMMATTLDTSYMTPSDKSKGEGWTCMQTAITRSDSVNGAKAGTIAWAGLANSYFWVDSKSGLGGCILAQFLPWGDPDMFKLKGDFEKFVYDNVGASK